ncbi:dihydrofolate reductase family protein [Niabella sp. CC-SYL272]|uniref:dihydrofolate reductase family protein n=1 Tax=Niabella agricola TaxID=2891571 RepID=UPI001F4217C4|nr:dihydrofolate reductase family protein [Niabella agricola]MCF3108924.1 dihydrofolate reductase family protein [Niabella agricola]
MKITLYANVSVNGKLLLSDNPNHQVPPDIIGLSLQQINRVGNLVMGRKSFEHFVTAFGGIDRVREVLPDVVFVWLSATRETTSAYKVAPSPEAAVTYLEERGFDEILIGGGTETCNVFLEKDLVTDVVFNVMPMITAGGVLGGNGALNINLRFVGQERLGNDVLQLRYTKH